MPTADENPGMSGSRRGGGAVAVAAGIFLSRIAGLVRERVIAHYLALSPAAGAFRAALRIPNLLQNLLGEGVLSASFIPVYARLLAEGREAEAAKVARVIGTLLALVASAIALIGVFAAEPLVGLLAPGFDESTRELTVELVQILFPGTTLLVMSAWCLGVLNSHRRFFLSYVSPVLWNAAMIAAAVAAGGWLADGDNELATWLAIGAVVGSALQFLVQLPTVVRLLRGISPSLATRQEGVRATLRAFVPVIVGRGSVQISAYIDQVLASYLGSGIVAAMSFAQTLYLLPISLFGMAISAAELPEMAGGTGDTETRAKHLQVRLASSMRRVAFLVVPSAVAFVMIGGSLVALVFETGRFGGNEANIVWGILIGSSLGLIPNTQGRLLASAFYALGDPKPPLRAALVRVAITTLLGYLLTLPLRERFGYGVSSAAMGLTAASSAAAWIEAAILYVALHRRIGGVPLPVRFTLGALAASVIAGAIAFVVTLFGLGLAAFSWRAGIVSSLIFGGVYLGIMIAAKVPEAGGFARRLRLRR
ncbi:MAG: murein biosynthesis integral membrane protein MurJ [Kofleriaceae bacterium]